MYLFCCILWVLQAYRKILILFYKYEPQFLVIRGKAGITVALLYLSVCSIFYLWPLYKHVVHIEKLLPSGENLFILGWRLRVVALAVLLEGWWWGGVEHLEHGKCSVSLFQISVGQYLLPENHFSKCPGNVWTKNRAGGWTRKCLIPQCSFAFF